MLCSGGRHRSDGRAGVSANEKHYEKVDVAFNRLHKLTLDPFHCRFIAHMADDAMTLNRPIRLFSQPNFLLNSAFREMSESVGLTSYWTCRYERRIKPGSVMSPKRIGLIGYNGVVAIDLAGPAEVFGSAKIGEAEREPKRCYEVITIASSNRAFVADSGLMFKPQKTFQNAPPLDTLIVPGGVGLRDSNICRSVSAFIKKQAGRTRRIASVCTGIYALASTGLLSGRKVTTHWRWAHDVARRFPDLQINDNAIFLKDGPFYTSAGATAGIDLSLSLVEEDYGPGVAMAVARLLVVYLRRSGGQEQYSEPLQFQTQSGSRLSDLVTWILSHLNEDLSVEVLAAKACLCPRHFSRRFKAELGHTPAGFVERLRLDEARRRLEADNSIDNVGLSVGFKSADAFRRAFERRLGINPSDYRRRLRIVPSPHQRRELNRISVAERSEWSFPHPITGKLAV